MENPRGSKRISAGLPERKTSSRRSSLSSRGALNPLDARDQLRLLEAPGHGAILHKKSSVLELVEERAEASPATTSSEWSDMTVKQAAEKLKVNLTTGLSAEDAENRLEEYGYNALPEVKVSKCLKFLSFMWNPLSWVMEAAALVSILLANGPTPYLCPPDSPPECYTKNEAPDYPDFIGIACLLLLNSAIGYYEESVAGDAVAALMGQHKKEKEVFRDGAWVRIPAAELVPGDVITIKLGDIVPADCKIVEGEKMLIDQSALTGETMPIKKTVGAVVWSGSTVKQGENLALVYATGIETFLGKAANLVQNTSSQGHLQQVLTRIGSFCLAYISAWLLVLCVVLYARNEWDYRRGINQILVALIGGVPIAMPTVLSVTMAIGVNELAKENAVVTRITAVEELAGMDILCSDKTGTLTQNKLSCREPSVMPGYDKSEIMLFAALASRWTGDRDAVDLCVSEANATSLPSIEQRYEILKFHPFDPESKRTIALVRDKQENRQFLVTKGAPQVILKLCADYERIKNEQNAIVEDYAIRGFRALGVAKSDSVVSMATDIRSGMNDPAAIKWDFVGLLSISDPPRSDTKATIDAALKLGVRIIMLTGDQVAIGRETGRELGMQADNFFPAGLLDQPQHNGLPIENLIEQADGWGEVMPQHKYQVVKTLQKGGQHIVGMTGDGVNDAPALKVSDVGIAVAGATDAARSSADIVLMTDGLSVIIKAIIGSRCIFARMKSYATYACATTVRVVTTFGGLSTAFEFGFPPFAILIVAILNDGTIMSISTDRVTASPIPEKWKLFDIFAMSFGLGLYLSASTLVFYWLVTATSWFPETFPGLPPLSYNTSFPTDDVSFETTSLIYLQVSISGQLIIFSTRARSWFFTSRPSNFLIVAFVIAQLVATLIAVYADWGWTQMHGITWGWAAVAWVWSLLWAIPMDIPKIAIRRVLEGDVSRYVYRPKRIRFPERSFHAKRRSPSEQPALLNGAVDLEVGLVSDNPAFNQA